MPAPPIYDDPALTYDGAGAYTLPVSSAPGGIETWVTEPDGTYLAHLDRSAASPFRAFAFSRLRNQAGSGSLAYHLDNALLAATPTLLDLGNLVHMKYRGLTRVWIIEDESTVLDEQEHETDWRTVSGRGVLQLLGDRIIQPTVFREAHNWDPSTWGEDNQWRRVTNRAAGEMLWDLIDESNERFATQITRGTVQTNGDDAWTQDLRFENLLTDLVKPVTDAFGDVEMDGLAFNYYNSQGGDRSGVVIFEEGADLLRLQRQRSDRDRVSYVVGEGVGEGVFAKLAIAERVDDRRIEGFVSLKEAGNEPLLQLLTAAALNEHTRTETLSFDVDESRYRAFVDFDLGDAVRVIASSRGVDAVQRIDAIYVAEDGDRVRVALDLAGLRADELLAMNDRQQQTASSLGVRNRQPQGQLVPFSFNGADVFDETDTMDVFLLVPERMYVLIEARAMIRFREFFAPATAAESGGGVTSSSAGGSTPTTSSGGSSTPTTASGGGSTSGGTSADHVHVIGIWASDTPGAYTMRRYAPLVSGPGFNLETSTNANLETSQASDDHTHSVASHTHSVSIGAHTHDVTIAAHDHDVAAHAHALTYGVFKEAMPASHSVVLGVYQGSGSSWTLVVSISGLTEDVEDVDLTQYIDGPGNWRLTLQSAGGQPQGGRLGCDVSGFVLGAIMSA